MTRVIYTNEHGAKYLAEIVELNKNPDSINYWTYEILVTHCIMGDGSIFGIVKPFSKYHVPAEQLSREGVENG